MFDSSLYRAVRRPLLEAESLPAHCYTSDKFFHREKNKIFATSWHFVGREDEVAKPGQFLVVDTAVGSALVMRDAKGGIGAFANACRHRGIRLKNQSGQCKGIVCPYHSWVYEVDGSLRAAPGMEGVKNFNQADYGLKQFRLEKFGGFLFVNFSNNGPSLIHWLGDLPDRFACHRLDELRCIRRLEFDIKANWKFLIGNSLEAYHTGTVHRATLGQQESAPVTSKGNWDALFVYGEEDKSISTLPGEQQPFPFIQGLSGDAKIGTWFSVIYPCSQIVFSQDCVWWQDFKPVAADRTKMTLGACFPISTMGLENFEDRVQPYFHRWTNATPEDNTIAEAQQAGHLAGLDLPGRYAATEHCVHRLDNWVLNKVVD